MLNTVKAKIIFLMLLMFVVLTTIAVIFALGSYKKNKKQKIEICDNSIAYFAETVNKSIKYLEGNASDLAIMGEFYFGSKNKDEKLLDKAVKHNFQTNRLAIGGGVWFEPNAINKDEKLFCRYAFFDGKDVVIDKSFQTEKYNYPKQSWYKEIKAVAEVSKKPKWTTPYFDQTGTHSLMTTVGAGIYDDKNNLVGMSTVDWKLDSIINSMSALMPTKSSYLLYADHNNDFVLLLIDGNNNAKLIGKPLKNVGWYSSKIENRDEINIDGKNYIAFKRILDKKMLLIMNVPTDELLGDTVARLQTMLILLVLICLIVTIIIYFVLAKNINKPIKYLLEKTDEIGGGNLDTKIELKTPAEFATLGSSFNKMTSDIKEYVKNITSITVEKKRIESELEIAKSIQQSTLPNVFPPYPEHEEFEVFASMNAAKEVGGDFYDFFLMDEDHFAFLIADVSGKGIPAALFMMTTSTLIKNLGQSGLAPDELMNKVNAQICKTNEQVFFVSVFLCVLELSTGKLVCVNGGHNLPLIKRGGKKWEYMNIAPNLVVGAMDDVEYKSHEIQLEAGDQVFLYTDGVTEALNPLNELFGEDRLAKTLDETESYKDELFKVLGKVKKDVYTYADGAPQSDDITMLLLKYKGNTNSVRKKSAINKK